METSWTRPFEYRNYRFALRVEQRETGLYLPIVRCQAGPQGEMQNALPVDADPYASEPEAWRHAEQQAMRWVHDRTGDGQGQF